MIGRRLFLKALVGGLIFSKSSFASEVKHNGPENSELDSIDKAIAEFIHLHKIPGAAVAIGRGGKLLYAKGFGVKQRLNSEPVEVNSLFRIASVSKPITAIAVLQLVQQGEFALGDSICRLLKLREPHDALWQKITVEHLLRHTGGFDRDKSFDPMFHFREVAKTQRISYPVSHQELIDYMLNQPLDHEPGSVYAYSNFGYCLLGRLIEKISGMTYEAYVRDSIWQPIAVTDVHVGHSLLEKRFENEVCYHDTSDRTGTPVVATSESRVPYPYGVWDISAMDAHGGWVCSAPQLVRLASDFDFPSQSKLLEANFVEAMFAAESASSPTSDQPVGYGLGWQVRKLKNGKKNVWHTGRLDGTAALLVKRHDGFNWAALFNTHLTDEGKYIIELFDPLMHKVVDQVNNWPEHDLFTEVLS